MNLNWVPLIVLGFFNFNFPIDFYRGSVGGSVSGSVDRGSVFCRNPKKCGSQKRVVGDCFAFHNKQIVVHHGK